MNIDDAVRVLNEHGHGDGGEWRIVQVHKDEKLVADSDLFEPGGRYLLEFEAIAIAEKLERDAGRDMPATRRAMRGVADAVREMEHGGRTGADEYWFSEDPALALTLNELRAALAEWEAKP